MKRPAIALLIGLAVVTPVTGYAADRLLKRIADTHAQALVEGDSATPERSRRFRVALVAALAEYLPLGQQTAEEDDLQLLVNRQRQGTGWFAGHVLLADKKKHHVLVVHPARDKVTALPLPVELFVAEGDAALLVLQDQPKGRRFLESPSDGSRFLQPVALLTARTPASDGTQALTGEDGAVVFTFNRLRKEYRYRGRPCARLPLEKVLTER